MTKLLVAGCGSIGRRHATNAAAIATAAVYDLDAERARDCAGALGVIAFSNIEAALQWAPDGVVVATPHSAHLAVAEAAIASGADVLIEKPIAPTMDGLEDLLQHADAAGRKIFTVCNLRYHPAVATLHAHIDDIGEPRFARVHYGNYLPNMRPNVDYRDLYCARAHRGGGVILDAIHEIDYLTWLFGPVAAVGCEAARLSQLDIDVEDYAAITLRHTSGVRSVVELDYLRPVKGRGAEIVGSVGILNWQSDGKAPEHCQVRLWRDGSWCELLKTTAIDPNVAYRKVMEHFVESIDGAPCPLLDGRTAAAELATALAAHAAAATDRVVLLA